MKFEFDHKTGIMRPKKDEEIYFAQSQDGGLIVDDKKHNIKYIIERDERITKLFGNFDKDNLNLYDMRDARIISDRVIRLLGRDHKYSDFHYFLKGYVMKENVIKSCTDFIGESAWGDMMRRGSGDEIRKEDEVFYNNMSKFEFLDYLNSNYKDKVVEIEKWGSKINVQFNSHNTHSKYGFIRMFIEFIEYPYSEENKIKRIIITSSKPNNLLKALKTRFIVKKMYPDNWDYKEGQEKPIWLVINGEKNTVVDIFEFILNNKLNESIWSDLQDRSAGETVRKEEGRIIGRDHKYSDFHYFLKGYHMNENFVQKMSDFLDESAWGDMMRRGSNDVVRREDGKIIGELEDGTKLIISNDAFFDGDLVDFDGSNIYTFNESGDEPIYIAVISDENKDVYYKYDEDSEDIINMIRCFDADESLRTNNDFGMLRALMNQDEWDNSYIDDLEVSDEGNHVNFEFSDFEFVIYDDIDKAKDDAVEDAIEIEKESLKGLKNKLSQEYLSSTESEKIRKQFHEFIDNIRNNCGNDGFDEDELKDVFKESFEFDYDEFDEEDAIEALLSREIIEDTGEYFGLDEDGETDHSLPKFDYQDYKDKYVEKSMEDLGDYIDEYISRFGYDGIEDYIDFDKVGERYVDIDGPANWLAGYDNVDREQRIDYETYYIYRKR